MDKRFMSLFRVGLALCVLEDLIERSSDISAHYTDLGIITHSQIAEKYANYYTLSITWRGRRERGKKTSLIK